MFDLDGAGKCRPIVKGCKWVQCTHSEFVEYQRQICWLAY